MQGFFLFHFTSNKPSNSTHTDVFRILLGVTLVNRLSLNGGGLSNPLTPQIGDPDEGRGKHDEARLRPRKPRRSPTKAEGTPTEPEGARRDPTKPEGVVEADPKPIRSRCGSKPE